MAKNGSRTVEKIDHVVKIVIVGDGTVGKTSMMLRFCNDTFSGVYIDTVGVDFKVKYMNVLGKLVKVEVWDTAGQEKYLSITTRLYRGAHAIILAYDVTSVESFQHVRDWMDRIYDGTQNESLVALVGNKLDLAEQRKIKTEVGKKLADNFRLPFFETSVKTRENVDQLFDMLVESIVRKMANSTTQPDEVVKLDKTEKKTGKNCC